MESAAPQSIPVVPDATSEDNAWALPRPTASRRQKVVAAMLAVSCVSLTSFAVGVSVGKTRAPDTAGGAGRNGGFGGFGTGAFGTGGPGAAAAPGALPASAGSTATTTTTVDPSLGGLLPGLDVAPDTTAITPTIVPTTTAPSGS